MSEVRSNQVYSWQAAYNAAILETDNAAMPLRLYEALAAIEQRRLSPIEENGEEDRALRAAQRAYKPSERSEWMDSRGGIRPRTSPD